jgi:hypothetical protein
MQYHKYAINTNTPLLIGANLEIIQFFQPFEAELLFTSKTRDRQKVSLNGEDNNTSAFERMECSNAGKQPFRDLISVWMSI